MAGALEGKRLFYEEDGEVLEVDVVEDTSDHKWVRFKLKQVRVVSAGPYKTSPDGEEFDVCSRSDGHRYGGMWTLRAQPGGMVLAPFVGRM
jgi:hypothetical protein